MQGWRSCNWDIVVVDVVIVVVVIGVARSVRFSGARQRHDRVRVRVRGHPKGDEDPRIQNEIKKKIAVSLV